VLLPSAAAAADDEPICADRPGQGNSSCTVPAGMVQVETTFVDWTRDRSGGERTEELVIGETAFKLGLNSRMDVELVVSPLTRVTVRDAGARERETGFGDLTLRAKYRVTAESSAVEATILPFVKIPTAKRSLGNGKVEGGIAVPIQWSIPGSHLSVTLGPEIDIVADQDGNGYHAAMVQLAGLGVPLTSRLSVSGDILGSWDWDPAGTVRQFSAGVSAAYLLSNDVQLDAGLTVGLNAAAADVQAYSGIAFRF